VEHLIRFMSWTFVFGALATLLYTNFKPALKELLDTEIAVESVQGSASGAEPGTQDGPPVPETAQTDCSEADPSGSPGECSQPSS
jgi:hypothetical protein